MGRNVLATLHADWHDAMATAQQTARSAGACASPVRASLHTMASLLPPSRRASARSRRLRFAFRLVRLPHTHVPRAQKSPCRARAQLSTDSRPQDSCPPKALRVLWEPRVALRTPRPSRICTWRGHARKDRRPEPLRVPHTCARHRNRCHARRAIRERIRDPRTPSRGVSTSNRTAAIDEERPTWPARATEEPCGTAKGFTYGKRGKKIVAQENPK